jgi:integrase/recombinase XerC
MPGTLKDLIPPFLDYLKFEKRYSAHTIRSYSTDLQQLEVYLDAKYGTQDIGDLSTPLLRSWLVSLKETGTEPRSINRKISAIKSFFRFHGSESDENGEKAAIVP